jgi:transposase
VKFEVTKNQFTLKSRTMIKGNKLHFEGETIYCGVDVHKTNWKVSARMNNLEIEAFSQDPNPSLLKSHFERQYPGAELKVVYEAGFCGFGIQRSLTRMGINCIVVNAADVPTADKDRKRKNDKRDARKLSLELAKGNLRPIYIPEKNLESARSLVRQRYRLVKDQSRCINRIKHLMLCNGLKASSGSDRISLTYIKELQQLDCGSETLKRTLHFAIEEYLRIRGLIKEITYDIRSLSKAEPFVSVQGVLQSVDGVGLISGMVIQTEIQDMNRFKTLDSLCDYAGFVPDIYSSNEKMVTMGISPRANEFLRETIIECSWTLIRKDPAMLMKYNEYRKRMNANKAIIRISKHLLSRIRHLWKNGKTYEKGIVG